MPRTLLALLTLTGALALVGCGGDDAADEAGEAVTPAQAAAEIDEIQGLLDQALSQYRSGDAEAAEQTVGDAYLEHFEEVEDPLGEVDHDFMERLEGRISTDIRNLIKDGASEQEVEELIVETKTDLDRAKSLLQGG